MVSFNPGSKSPYSNTLPTSSKTKLPTGGKFPTSPSQLDSTTFSNSASLFPTQGSKGTVTGGANNPGGAQSIEELVSMIMSLISQLTGGNGQQDVGASADQSGAEGVTGGSKSKTGKTGGSHTKPSGTERNEDVEGSEDTNNEDNEVDNENEVDDSNDEGGGGQGGGGGGCSGK